VTGQPDTSAEYDESPQSDGNASQNFTELHQAVVQVNQLGDNVHSGKVTLDPAVGAGLVAALRAHSDDIADWQRQVGSLARELPMGANPVGSAMGQKFSQRAVGHDVALSTVLAQYRATVDDATGAIENAMSRYRGTEEEIHQSLGRIQAD
jgi:hypothetical protein